MHFGGGSSFPGKLALKLNPHIISYLAKDFSVIMVTGTNGKTTTCSMLYNILRNDGKSVISNSSGANMLGGIATCFLNNYGKGGYAVIETDEAYAKYLTKEIKPLYILVTNIFRDQLDRFGEVYTTWNLLYEAILNSPSSTLILNADEAIFGEIGLPNPVIYYGFACGNEKESLNTEATFCQKCGEHFKFNFLTFNNLGDYYCNCGFKRPPLDHSVDEINELSIAGSVVVIDGNVFSINVPGLYNVYNALAAASAAFELGIPLQLIQRSLGTQESKFGRHENIDIDGKSVHIVLIKNPTGCDQCINTIALEKEETDLVFLLNDNYADGTDVSWIWDGSFENLNSMNCDKILIGGTRRYDMAIRLKAAGFDENKFVIIDDYQALISNITKRKTYIFATYTAMTGFRKHLYSLGYIKKMW